MIPTSSCAALAPGTRESTAADPARLEAAFVFTRHGAVQFREGGSEPADHSYLRMPPHCHPPRTPQELVPVLRKWAKTVCSSLDSHYRYRGAPHPSKPTPRATALVATRPIPGLAWPPTFPARPPLPATACSASSAVAPEFDVHLGYEADLLTAFGPCLAPARR